MKTRPFALLLSFLVSFALHAAEPTVDLIEPPGAPTPTRSLELRFGQDMIPSASVGQPTDAAPVVTEPKVAGQWTWQSMRSGIFVPSEPWPLGAAVQIHLRENLKTLDGQPLPKDWKRTLNLPAFALQAWSNLSYRSDTDASAEPEIALLFNADVTADSATESLRFVRAGGAEIPAKVTGATTKRPGLSWYSKWLVDTNRSLLTWTERFRSEAMPSGLRGNQLFITPAKPLPVGEGWRLIVKAGLPASRTDQHTTATTEIPIGTVQPFAVREIEATNIINSPKTLRITFTKSLRADLKPDALNQWIKITPEPAKLAATIESNRVEYTGEFVRDQSYHVTVEPGIPSAEPFMLKDGVIRDTEFEPIPPRLYFQAYQTHQMRAGERKFHLLAVNAPKIKVSAKLFTGTGIPNALRRYDDYFEAPKGQDDESHSKIDPDKLAGKVIWQQVIDGTQKVDEQQEVTLDWTKIIGPDRTGVVLLTAEQVNPPADQEKRPGTQSIVQLTDLGAVWKRSPSETFMHVFSMKTGKAIGGAKVRLLDENDKVLGSGAADENGIARLPAVTGARWVFVETGTDSHVIEFRNGENYIDLARVDVQFSEDEDQKSSADGLNAFLFTERDVYRPGETVHLKGIVRDWRAGKKPLASGLKLTASVFDARDRQITTRDVTLNNLGSFSEDFAMPTTPLGFYRVELTPPGEAEHIIASKEFQVEEFKPNAFEILVGDGPKVPGPADLSLPVTAKYYMGKSLSKAQMTWSVNAHDEDFDPEGFSDFDFGDAITDYRLREHFDRRGGVSLQGKVTLDDQGSAKVEARVPLNDKAPQPRAVQVLCEVTDINQQTVSQSKNFTLHSSDFYLGIRNFRSLLHIGEPVPIDIVAVRTDGTPVPEPVTFSAKLSFIDWQNNRVQNADDTTEYRNEPVFKALSTVTWKSGAVTKAGDHWSVAPTGNQPFVPEQPGQYMLELTTKDSAGRAVVTSTSFQVYGVGATAWDYRNPYQVELVPEKDGYTAGETAKILVKTPISGDALITVEREKVIRSFITHPEGNAPVVEVPMLPADAPNIFVSVMLLRGADASPRKYKAPEYRIGYCELKVIRPDAKLTVYVKPEAKAYQPGDEVKVSAEILDFEGKPVRDAEVTLYAVDEGILSLTAYETPDPLTFFNEPRPLTVSTALTLPSLLNEDPEHRDFENKGYLIGGGGDDSNNLRKNFLTCAFWNAVMKTDATGKIQANFTAPDSLTRYRIMAVVQTAKDQFGKGESAFEVSKPVMLEPALPRFANVSDKMALRAVVHNTTDLAGEAEVKVVFDRTVKAQSTTTKIQLPAKGTAAIDFPVEFLSTGTAVWKWSVNFKSGETTYKDAVQSTLKVGYPAPLLRSARTMRVDGSVANLLDGVDPQLMEGTGFVRVSFTNSRAIELQEALNQLLHYPYGCVEQTTSSTLPWLTLRKLNNQLPSLQRSNEEVEKAINYGVSRIFTMQTESGGLAYWPGESRPMLWGSAYGSLLLTMAKQQGYAVPQEDYDRLMKWMSEQLRGTADVKNLEDLRERCLVVYALALAGRAEPAYHTTLFEKRALLSQEDAALLALAMVESKGPATMIDQLLNTPKTAEEDYWFGSPARTMATQLLCWSRYKTASPRSEALAQGLFEARRDGHWWTTQGNAWAVMAMGDYLSRTERDNKSIAGKLKWSEDITNFALGAKPETKTQTFPVLPSLAHAPMALTTTGAKGGKLYTAVTVESYPVLREQPAQDRGYILGRRYSKIEDDGTLSDAKNLRVGDRVMITLSMEIRQRAGYVAIEDPLPANFEAVNPTFKTQQMVGAQQVGNDWLSDYRELREDRALFFANSVFPGRYIIRYLARVTAAGEATAPCAKIEEMYHPERCGLTAAEKVKTLPLQ